MTNKNVRRTHELPVLQWLRVGAVAAGVGAAVVAGQGVAVADPGNEPGTETKTEPQETPAKPDPEPAAEAAPEPDAEEAGDDPTEVRTARSADSPKKSPRRATALSARQNAAGHAIAPSRRTTTLDTTPARTGATATTAATTTATAAAAPAEVAAPALPPQATIEITKATPTPPSLARPIRQAVLGVLGIFGFNPNPGSTNNPLLEALWGTYRRIESILGNRPATARTATITTTEIIDDTVQVTGAVTFDDPNGDPLRYSTTQGEHGSVVINPNGTFVYTPTDPSFTGTDTFTVTANDDKNFHLHGPLAFLRPDWGHTSSATLTITLDKAGNVAPVITDHTPGSFTVTDANGDPITLTVSQTTKGTVTYVITPDAGTPGVHTVTYTYTPNFAARLAASYAGEDAEETLTFTATDGTATSLPLTITATIAQFEPHTVIAKIPVGANPIGLALSPDGTTAYTANWGDGTVSVINLATNTVTATIAVGVNPYELVVSPNGKTVYVVNNQAGSVSVIDTATNTVTATIAKVALRPQTIVISPNGKTLYVGDSVYPSVTVIDTATNTVTFQRPLGVVAADLVMSPDGKFLYISDVSHRRGPVEVFDTATNRSLETIFVENPILRITVSPDGKTLYATAVTPTTYGVTIVDIATRAVTGSIDLGIVSTQPAISPDGTIAYVTHAADGLVSVIDTGTGTVITTIPIGTGTHPAPIAFSANGDFAYTASNPADGSVAVIWTGLAAHHAIPAITVEAGNTDPATGAVVLTVTTSDADGDHVAVTVSGLDHGTVVNNGDGRFTYTPTHAARIAATTGSVTDTLTFTATDAHGDTSSATSEVQIPGYTANTVIANIDLGFGNNTHDLALSADGKTAYTSAWGADKVFVIDTATNTVVTTIAVGVKPTGLALHPDGTTLWVTNTDGKTVSVIDTATNAVLHTLTNAGSSPHLVVFSTDGAYAYIVQQANADDANVVVLNTQTRAVVTTIDTNIRHTDAVMAPDGSAIYLSSQNQEFGNRQGFVLVIDTATNTVAATIPDPAVAVAPGGVAVSPDGGTVYAVAGAFPEGVMIIDADTNTVIDRIEMNSTGALEKIAVSPDGSRLLVTDGLDNTLVVVDIASKSILTTIDLPFDLPLDVTFSPDGTLAYVTYLASGAVSVIATGLAPHEAV